MLATTQHHWSAWTARRQGTQEEKPDQQTAPTSKMLGECMNRDGSCFSTSRMVKPFATTAMCPSGTLQERHEEQTKVKIGKARAWQWALQNTQAGQRTPQSHSADTGTAIATHTFEYSKNHMGQCQNKKAALPLGDPHGRAAGVVGRHVEDPRLVRIDHRERLSARKRHQNSRSTSLAH